MAMNFSSRPATPELIPDLFLVLKKCWGCWCMYFRSDPSEFKTAGSQLRKEWMESLVRSGRVPGIIGYWNGTPMAWCSLAPRPEFSRLDRSRFLKPVDDLPVWSIVCFWVNKEFRGQGVTELLLKDAMDFGRSQGAKAFEAYPFDPAHSKGKSDHWYTGVMSTFQRLGFCEVARRSPKRPIMRMIDP